MPDVKNNGYKLKENEGIKINFRRTEITVKFSGDGSDGRYTLIEMLHPPNTDPALYIHSKAPKAYYLLDGYYSIRCGNKIYQAHLGECVFIPKRVPHNYRSGPQGGKALVITPAGIEKYFKKLQIFSINKTIKFHGIRKLKLHDVMVRNFWIILNIGANKKNFRWK